jgi:hypothetical protein
MRLLAHALDQRDAETPLELFDIALRGLPSAALPGLSFYDGDDNEPTGRCAIFCAAAPRTSDAGVMCVTVTFTTTGFIREYSPRRTYARV